MELGLMKLALLVFRPNEILMVPGLTGLALERPFLMGWVLKGLGSNGTSSAHFTSEESPDQTCSSLTSPGSRWTTVRLISMTFQVFTSVS